VSTETKTEKRLSLTIRATNGATWVTEEFKENTKVKQVIKKAVEHFVDEGAMSQGDYRLAIVLNDQAQPPLGEESKLGDDGVHDGSLLVLVARDEQVDG
jgi:hypothetical protein